jgi:hypothetical protein
VAILPFLFKRFTRPSGRASILGSAMVKSLILDDADPRRDLHIDASRFLPSFLLHRRRKFVIGFVLSLLSLLVPAYLYFSRPPALVSTDIILQQPGVSIWNRMSARLGSPTDRFRGSSTP